MDAAPAVAEPKAAKAAAPQKEAKLNLPEGAISVARVYQDVAQLAGQKVKVSGKVVKFNAAILGVN